MRMIVPLALAVAAGVGALVIEPLTGLLAPRPAAASAAEPSDASSLVAVAPEDDDRAAGLALRRTPVVEVFEKSRRAVVNIASTEIVTVRSRSPFDGLFENFFDMMPRNPGTRRFKRGSLGSGFVIHPDGYIVTNAHVVVRATEHRVSFADGAEYPAVVVAADEARDLAVLKVDADRPLPTLPLGRSDDLMIGETVVAIGNPLGYESTVTAGVVSAVGREIAVSSEVSFTGLIQTDASINPGNSGGPLLNVLGELIGINTAIRGDAQNIGFAIPVDHLREVLPELLDVERRYNVVLGLRLEPGRQARVAEVVPDTPAAEAGIRAGDVLRAIDGRPVRESVDFDISLLQRRPGDRIRLALDRGGRPLDLTLRLAERPRPDGTGLARARLGAVVASLPEDLAAQLGLRQGGGVLVREVLPGGPAEASGLARRDIILALGRHAVTSVDDLGALLDRAPAGTDATVMVLRLEGGTRYRLSGPITIR